MLVPDLARRVLTATLTVLGVVLALGLLYLLRGPISWLVVAVFIAVALAGPVRFLSRRMPRGLAITLTYLGLLLVPIGLALIVVPPLVREADKLIQELPRYVADLEAEVRANERLQELNAEYGLTAKLQEEAAKLPGRVGDAAQLVGDLGLGIVNSTFAAITILILSAFLLANGGRWVEGLLKLQPAHRRPMLREVLGRMGGAVGAYVAGAVAQALVAGITTYIVLTILGVPFAAPLAVLVGLFDLIPMVGASIGAVIVAAVTLVEDFPVDFLIWGAWAVAYQQLENNLIQPRIQNRAVGVHPFVVIVAVLFGGTLLGVPGALLAVPVAAAIQIVVVEVYRARQAATRASQSEGAVTSAAVGSASGAVQT